MTKAFKKILTVAIMIPTIFVVLLLVYSFLDAAFANQQASKSQYVGKTLDESYWDAKNANPEVIGWVYLFDTGVCQPICQTTNNSFYLDHNVYKQKKFGGCPFLDCKADPSMKAGVPIVYGHAMEGNAMFSDVNRYSKESFATSHTKGCLCIDGKWYHLDVVNLCKCSDGDSAIYYAYDDSKNQKYLDRVEECLVKDLNPASLSDNLIGLSTCTDSGATRHVLTCKIGQADQSLGSRRVK